jgi:hypothetical protein
MQSAGYLSAPAGTITPKSSLVLSPEDVADSMSALAETYFRPDAAGVCVADGFGVRVVVERGALEVHDGVGPHRRSRRYDRATHGLRRLVILNAAGTVSLDALRWCASLGVGVLVLGSDGTAQLASTPRMTDDARLRRTQALAPFEGHGLDVARWLMFRKIQGQGKLVLRRFGDSETAETIGDLALAAEGVETIDELRQLEASAAALYFGAWSSRAECAPTFATKDLRRIPPHWSRYEGRRSVLASAAPASSSVPSMGSTGCAVPTYHRQGVQYPPAWQHARVQSGSPGPIPGSIKGCRTDWPVQVVRRLPPFAAQSCRLRGRQGLRRTGTRGPRRERHPVCGLLKHVRD